MFDAQTGSPMKIDRCTHDFDSLARVVVPKHMNRLRQALKCPVAAAGFVQPRTGVKTVARALGRAGDFRGCYVFLAHGLPFYVGISKKVIERIRQHLRGRSHFEATLAYRIAQRSAAEKRSRAENMDSPAFLRRFAAAQRRLAEADVAFVEVQNPLELYLLEVYAAMALQTGRWNSFDTH
jgi:hypothetical protein